VLRIRPPRITPTFSDWEKTFLKSSSFIKRMSLAVID